jgi:hypothetical protein
LTKKEFIELFSESMRSGDNSDDTKQKYHPEVMAAYLDLALENINSSKVLKGMGSFDSEGLDVLTRTLDCVDVVCVKGRNGFVMPPFQNISFGQGIRMIVPTDSFNQFHWVETSTLYASSNLDVFKQGNWFTVSGNNVTLWNAKPETVTIVYIPKLRELADDDEVNFMQGSGAEVFQLAKQLVREHSAGKSDNTNQGIVDAE